MLRPKGPGLLVPKGSAPQAKAGPLRCLGLGGAAAGQEENGQGLWRDLSYRRPPEDPGDCPYSRKDKRSVPAVPHADPGRDPPR